MKTVLDEFNHCFLKKGNTVDLTHLYLSKVFDIVPFRKVLAKLGNKTKRIIYKDMAERDSTTGYTNKGSYKIRDRLLVVFFRFLRLTVKKFSLVSWMQEFNCA